LSCTPVSVAKLNQEIFRVWQHTLLCRSVLLLCPILPCPFLLCPFLLCPLLLCPLLLGPFLRNALPTPAASAKKQPLLALAKRGGDKIVLTRSKSTSAKSAVGPEFAFTGYRNTVVNGAVVVAFAST
jgi:hypothetical protein